MSNTHARRRVKTDAYIALYALKSKFKESKGNGHYAADAWVVCRQANIKPPKWVLDAVDVVARVNRFEVKPPPRTVSGVKEARGAAGERKLRSLLATAWKRHWGSVRSNETWQVDWLRIDRESLAAVVERRASEAVYGHAKGAHVAPDEWRERLSKCLVNRPVPASIFIRAAADPGRDLG